MKETPLVGSTSTWTTLASLSASGRGSNSHSSACVTSVVIYFYGIHRKLAVVSSQDIHLKHLFQCGGVLKTGLSSPKRQDEWFAAAVPRRGLSSVSLPSSWRQSGVSCGICVTGITLKQSVPSAVRLFVRRSASAAPRCVCRGCWSVASNQQEEGKTAGYPPRSAGVCLQVCGGGDRFTLAPTRCTASRSVAWCGAGWRDEQAVIISFPRLGKHWKLQ